MRMSSMARRFQCPASEKLEAKFPNTTNPAAERGTKLHAVCEDRWNEKDPNTDGLRKSDLDQADTAYIKMLEITEGCKVFTEIEVEVAGVKGHIDVLAIHPDGKAHIIDYKFGYTPVSAQDNWQLKAYAAGVSLWHPEVHTITTHILQPAIHYFGSQTYTKDEVESFGAEIKKLVALVKNEKLTPQPGDECKYCLAKDTCPSRVGIIASLQTAVSLPEYFASLTPKMRKDFWEKVQVAKKWVKEAEASVIELAGENPVAGYEVTGGRKTRVWEGDEKEVATALADLNVEPYKKSLRTPTDVLKECKEAESLTEWKPGNPTLKRAK